MKRLFIFTIILFLTEPVFSQKYLQLIPEIAPDSGACNGKVKAIMHGGVTPYNMMSMTNHIWEISTGTVAESICDGLYCSATFLDDECSELVAALTLYNDTLKQIYLDTVYITMPTSQSSCNGSISLVFRHIQPYHTMYFGTNISSSTTTSFSFTGLCSNKYFYAVTSPSSILEEYALEIDLRVNTIPCYDFDASIGYTPVQDTANCTGEIHVNTSGGSGGPFAFDFYHQVNGMFESVDYTQAYVNFRDSLCTGPYTIDVFNNYNNMRKRFSFYLDTYDNDSTWNEPDTLLPDTDTIILNAVANCAPNYLNGIDTAFISSIILIGNGQYEFGITLIQGNDTVNAYGNAVVDTSQNFFIDLTLFCEDTLRSMDSFNGKRNLIYHGVKLNTNRINELENFNSFKIYPNPFENFYSLEFELKKEEQITFELTDISGKVISSKNYSCVSGKNKLDFEFSNLSNGLYLLRTISENGQSVSKKIIKN